VRRKSPEIFYFSKQIDANGEKAVGTRYAKLIESKAEKRNGFVTQINFNTMLTQIACQGREKTMNENKNKKFNWLYFGPWWAERFLLKIQSLPIYIKMTQLNLEIV
jgi:hypothetical protein